MKFFNSDYQTCFLIQNSVYIVRYDYKLDNKYEIFSKEPGKCNKRLINNKMIILKKNVKKDFTKIV